MTDRPRKKRGSKAPIGEVFYEGPSLIDKEPIVGLLSLSPSQNDKLGAALLQTWIMLQDVPPLDAQKEGLDASVCGDCTFRPAVRKMYRRRNWALPTDKDCYVLTWRAPTQVWKAYKAGRYSREQQAIPSWAGLRLGAYGDPASIPYEAWEVLLGRFKPRKDGRPHWIGYTQQWRDCDRRMRYLCMASVINDDEAAAAAEIGWRYYRVRKNDDSLNEREFICPASAEEDHRLQCIDCMACFGAKRERIHDRQPASPVIIEH